MPRDLEKEKQMELAAIWGSEVSGGGEKRYPKRRRGGKESNVLADDDTMNTSGAEVGDGEVSESFSDVEDGWGREHGESSKRETRLKKKRKREKPEYRLHCFVSPGTEKNDVRTVFEAYNPKVEIRTSQKGNLLNKTAFAVLTFPNKAMALHAVQSLDGTNQRNLLGVPKLKLSLMLSREQSRIVRKKLNQQRKKTLEERWMQEVQEDTDFINKFLQENLRSGNAAAEKGGVGDA